MNLLSRRRRISGLCISTVLGAVMLVSGCGTSTPGLVDRLSAGDVQDMQQLIPDAQIKYNKDKIFHVLGGWPKPPLYQGNPFGSGGIGDTNTRYMYEGLFFFLRSMNNVYNRLAESSEDTDLTTTVHLQRNVKWHDGEAFTSKDVWGYYRLNNGAEVTKYLTSIDTPDDYTIVFHWMNPAPYPELRKLLLAQDLQGQIPYHIYKKYVDKADALLQEAKPLTDKSKDGPFNLDITEELSKKIALNWNEFTRSGPAIPVGTGPYKFEKVTTTDMLIDKFEDYWRPDAVHFDKIWIKNVPELSAQYALVKAGKLDWYDGTPPKDILESLLKQNKNLLHYRMYDPASVGLMYNIRNKPFDNVKFRQAMTYVLDKTKLREIGNYYGKEYPKISMTGVMPSSLDKEIDASVLDQMTDYTTNLDKAAELLKEIGWKKGSDGQWRDPDGKVPSFIIGAPNNWAPGVNSAQIAAEQFSKFGIPTKLKAVDSTIYFANADKGQYDMSMDWVDISWGFQNPWSSMRVLFWQGTKTKVGFSNIKKKDEKGNEIDTGKLDLKLPGIDGKIYDIDKEMKRFPYVQDEQERRQIIDNLAWIANENCWGVNFFQNATGAWINTKMMSGDFPMMEQIVQYNRDMPLATDPVEQLAITHLNHGFNSSYMPEEYWPR
ncbi:ABC transporter substrate-binding protein [Paenibacillus lupini]|uniref:ABC transporter substrate-binding protein n=1 Tax=Paenibacillus lupini TaxID=1450204 RepID=UPI00141DF927|nr:ABC transporter substrate-binding protein [Paenibacillus lupini]NIK21938.1 peptide/nickel transport system substrate-binding protein [Paenibacillus lupini]